MTPPTAASGAAPLVATPPSPRKRRPWWLFAPHLAVALLALGLSAGWVGLRAAALRALDAAPAQAAAAGVELAIGGRAVTGFPFRLRVALSQVRVARGGWGVEAPELVAQAYVYAPTHWVLLAPRGMVVARPQGGPLRVEGRALRASVSGFEPGRMRDRARVALVGEGVRFSVPAGARPFALQAAERVEGYLRPAGADAAFLLALTGAQPTPGGLAWRLSPAPFDAVVEGRATRVAAFAGRGAARDWARAGGALAVGHVEAKGGPTELTGGGGALGLDGEGRLAGVVPLRLRQSAALIASEGLDPKAPPPPGEARGASLDLVLEDGVAHLGPFRVGPAPKVG